MNCKLLKNCFVTITILLLALTNLRADFSTFSPPQNLGAIINSTSIEYLPIAAPSGLSFYFASDRSGGMGGRDIYVSQRATLTSAWGAPQSLGATINSSGNESVGSISPDGREMFIESDRPGGTGGGDIYLLTRTDTNNDFGWSAPVNIGTVINTVSGDNFGTYFVDPVTGTGTLFFNSDRSSGTGGVHDVFRSTRNADGTFNPPSPVNELNSPANEQRVSISRDGLEIFFASNRLGPTTTHAVFVSTRASISAEWNPPVSVGLLNTIGSNGQPALSPDGTTVYFVSNRPGGVGAGDLYSATRVSVNRTPTADFNGDGRTDLAVFRPSNGTWYSTNPAGIFTATQWGQAGDIPVAGDFDGDGRNDFTVYRGGAWHTLRTSDGTMSVTNWGLPTDVPVPGDYDGDGRTDVGIFRTDTWYIILSSDGHWLVRQFGVDGDVPIVAAAIQ